MKHQARIVAAYTLVAQVFAATAAFYFISGQWGFGIVWTFSSLTWVLSNYIRTKAVWHIARIDLYDEWERKRRVQ